MPSASPPDGPSTGADGEVVEVFTGDTLEEAMAAAVAALGPELTVRRARKVRAGVRGLLGRDRYEVLAVPPDGPAPLRPARTDDDGDAVGSALEALLEAADEREAGGPPARPVGRPSAARPLSARPTSDDLPPPLRPAAPGGPAPLPPAPRSGGSPLRRLRAAAPEPDDDLRALPPRDDDASRSAPSRPVPPAPDEVLDAAQPVAERPVRRRGRSPGLPLSGRSPHPDPAVADHPEPAPAGGGLPSEAPAAPDPAPHPDLDAPPVPQAGPAERRVRPRALDEPAPEPEPDEEEDEEEEPPAPRRPAPAAARKAPARKAAPATKGRRPRAAGWSRASLAGLGVPEAVLDALPDPAPRDDLAWVVALTAAIEATVPPPAEPDEQTPVVVSGHGVAGVVAVLDAGARGIAPGTISHAGRTAPATATELALVLRHHVTGGA